jgi:hypothetical protein
VATSANVRLQTLYAIGQMSWPLGLLSSGAATTASGSAHVGTNEPARQDALTRVPKWLEETQ